MMSSGCLVTSVPDYHELEQTAPFLIAASALPSVREVIVKNPQGDLQIELTVEVQSEDAGQKVRFELYTDYGSSPPPRPYANESGFGELPPSTLADENRKPLNKKTLATDPGDKRCHTLTLMASHAFDDSDTRCPIDLAGDSSQLTWVYVLCPDAQPCTQPCDPTLPEDGQPACNYLSKCDVQKDWTSTCPDKAGESTGGDAGVQ